MCTVVILRRPGDDWPLLLAANRDEMRDRPSAAPARHWPERAHVVAGIDLEASGTWLGLNDDGIAAAVLNRPGSLGPAVGYRSRGELPLEALDHADAATAAQALADIDPAAYRTFNMVVADERDAFWLRSAGEKGVEVMALPEGLSMITAHDRNDTADPRIRDYLRRFEAAPPPDPGAGDWASWGVAPGEPRIWCRRRAGRRHERGHGHRIQHRFVVADCPSLVRQRRRRAALAVRARGPRRGRV